MTTLAITQAVVPTRRARSADNVKFANDASLESVENLLIKLAIRCHKRVAAMGLGMDFDDVLQEMRVSYVQASRAWKPDGGSLFSTYCTTACMNNFNRVIKKMETERGELLIGTQSEFIGSDADQDDDGNHVFDEASVACELDSPDFRMERLGEMQATLAGLSPGAKRLVVALLRNQDRHQIDARLSQLAKQVDLQGDELRQVKLEILNKFGVQWR